MRILLLALSMLTVHALADGGTHKTVTVTIQGMKFNPASVEVSEGDALVFLNKDPMFHTATSGLPGRPSGIFNSQFIAPNRSYTWFVKGQPGEIPYFCIPHSSMMKGKVIIK